MLQNMGMKKSLITFLPFQLFSIFNVPSKLLLLLLFVRKLQETKKLEQYRKLKWGGSFPLQMG
jgi:hypothetical protein